MPSLAGLCSIADAMKPGLSVEQCVTRLKRYHYAFKRLHQIFTARITAERSYGGRCAPNFDPASGLIRRFITMGIARNGRSRLQDGEGSQVEGWGTKD